MQQAKVQLMGNVVNDATAKQINNKQVINFTIALNYEFTKATGELVKLPTFIDCQYWKKSDVHNALFKGRKVIVFGRMYPDAYTNSRGETKGVIRFKVDEVFLGEINDRADREAGKEKGTREDEGEPVGVTERIDDLPF